MVISVESLRGVLMDIGISSLCESGECAGRFVTRALGVDAKSKRVSSNRELEGKTSTSKHMLILALTLNIVLLIAAQANEHPDASCPGQTPLEDMTEFIELGIEAFELKVRANPAFESAYTEMIRDCGENATPDCDPRIRRVLIDACPRSICASAASCESKPGCAVKVSVFKPVVSTIITPNAHNVSPKNQR